MCVRLCVAHPHRFGSKEEYMLFMNDFLEKETVNMKQFVDRISVSVPRPPSNGGLSMTPSTLVVV